MALARAVPPDRLLWVETSLAGALASGPEGPPLDVVLTDPATEAPRLYALARLLPFRRVRVSILARPGVGRAGLLAVALRFPVRLLPGQPRPEQVEELEAILDRFLHDPGASQPVEFFHSALARLLHGHPAGLWEVLELDPARFAFAGERGERDVPVPPEEPGFVTAHVERLVAEGEECALCPFLAWCAGAFKWPRPGYDCAAVRRLLGRIEEAAASLRRDLSELSPR